MMTTLYQELIAAGVECRWRESDLYFPSTPQTRGILCRFPVQKQNAIGFLSRIDGKHWIEVPFAYDPFWEARGF